ncbi:chorismate-binding protein [Staphylococcus felis]|uniref:chorismate-binding protein n=1 Tax=Staphylococcus felis TaxID=46127 RepID=UPI000E284A18|nr:chorismate-binding protein [Staphylococcus felis]REH83312.1 aminodeoxychorismate synthase component I [Staphylococcus felis]REH88370.1 aminodeoxychorismate synthase component I [Staphylococcus felis]
MVVKFNYVYYNSPDDTTRYEYTFHNPLHYAIATNYTEVGRVVEEAEYYQRQGYYVALYLTYEAATYYNQSFEVNVPEDHIYAAYYAFEHPVDEEGESMPLSQFQMPKFSCIHTSDEIQKHIRTIQQEIISGWTYQVNYTTRFESAEKVCISTLYDFLTQKGNGHYTVLIDTEDLKIASISPELFFQVGPFGKTNERMIVSKPMKGTIQRGTTVEEDEKNFQELQQSAKDRAENVMIVDLLRNDIARIARTGTVEVKHPFLIEAYKTVFQMTTMVLGQVEKVSSYNEMFEALFPCGSITGAPKVNTMNIINQLESTPRHGYCGTIGLLHPDGKAIFNVPIRTVQQLHNRLVYGVGAGITIDSDPQKEYKEFLTKTKILEG